MAKNLTTGGFNPPRDKYPGLTFLRKEFGMDNDEFVSWIENAFLAAIGKAVLDKAALRTLHNLLSSMKTRR